MELYRTENILERRTEYCPKEKAPHLLKPLKLKPFVVQKRNLSLEEYDELLKRANREQRELVLEAMARCDDDHKPMQVFLTGPAGCGKTFTIQLLVETYDRRFPYATTIVCASTGKAAAAIQGTTVHSAFRFRFLKSIPLLLHQQLALREARAIIIDEASMISAELLAMIDERLKEVTGKSQTPFGGKHIFLVGDLRQLPPVCASAIYAKGPSAWHALKWYELKQIIRQPDPIFSALLTKIGNGELLTQEERQMIESRFVPRDSCSVSGVRLFYSNMDVDHYHQSKLSYDLQSVAVDEGCGSEHDPPDSTLPYVLPLEIGQPYMITLNLNLTKGIVNGRIGILQRVEWVENNIQRVWLKLEEEEEEVSITKRSVTIRKGCKRTQFPLIPALALTIHKAQGETFEQVVYDYDQRHSPQLVYVAMSRVTSLEGLFLTHARNDFTFYHGRTHSHHEPEMNRENVLVTLRDQLSEQFDIQCVQRFNEMDILRVKIIVVMSGGDSGGEKHDYHCMCKTSEVGIYVRADVSPPLDSFSVQTDGGTMCACRWNDYWVVAATEGENDCLDDYLPKNHTILFMNGERVPPNLEPKADGVFSTKSIECRSYASYWGQSVLVKVKESAE